MDDRIAGGAGAVWRSLAAVATLSLVCGCAGSRPVGGPEQEYSLTARSVRQPLDHETPDGPQFDQQVHVLVPDGCAPGAPVFFLLGGEIDATPERLARAWRTYGRPQDVIFVQAEHRGYGQSVSADEDQTVPFYVRIDQALADDHRVAQLLRGEFPGPWMVAGYSYGGALALWYGNRYPDGVRVVLSSSGAVDFPFATDAWDRAARRYWGEGAYRRLAGHVQRLAVESPFDEAWISREFLTGVALTIPQFQRYQRYRGLVNALSFLPTGGFLKTAVWLEGKVNGGEGLRRVRRRAARRVTRTEALTGEFQDRVWRYQQCAETGLFALSADAQGLLPRTAEEAAQDCRALFGAEPSAATGPRPSAREALDHSPVPVVYVEGGEDPSAGVLHDPGHRIANGTYVFVPGGRHCPDLADRRVGERVLAEMLRFAKGDGARPASRPPTGESRE